MSVLTQGEVRETIHGVEVSDPYRWLEDRQLPETDAWIREQQAYCNAYFANLSELAPLKRRVETYLDVEVMDQPSKVAGRYFYRKRRQGEEQGSIYMQGASSTTERLLVDPSSEGPFASVGIYRISPDSSCLAYECKRGGSDRKKIGFVDVDSGAILPDIIPLGYGRGLVFIPSGYLYSHETEIIRDEHTVHYHRFQSAGTDDIVFRAPRTPGSRVLLIGNAHRMGVIWLRPKGAHMIADFLISDLAEIPKWTEVFRQRRLPYNPILCHDRIFVLAESNTKRTRLIELSTEGKEVRTVVPESTVPIRRLVITLDRIFVSYQERAVTSITAWRLDGQQEDSISLPAGGTVQILPSPAQDTDSFFYSFESFDRPPTVYEHFPASNVSTIWHRRAPRYQMSPCHVREEHVRSRDGTMIPLTLVSLRPNVLDPPGPLIMTGYGGFAISMTPQFSVLVAIMLEMGATFALPHIRGGGEFGKAWHEAARSRNRQTSFDDFIATAEWLCECGMTTPGQLAIFGGSNSGLLVGAVMTQRPDLFRAVLCIAPLLDMVRYEHFDDAIKCRSEYGTVENREDFQALFAYSPYHRIAKCVNYPSTLFVSGDKDERCNPAHVRKMAALLQVRPAQMSPVLVDYSDERGHSPVLPLSTRISALARRLAFLCHELHMDVHHRGYQ